MRSSRSAAFAWTLAVAWGFALAPGPVRAQAQPGMPMRAMELDIECHADEFGYWRKYERKR